MKEKMQKVFERFHPIPRYILSSFIPWLIISFSVLGVSALILLLTGGFSSLVNTLNLRADSIWVIAPLLASLTLMVASFFAGITMYLMKYKRKVKKTPFGRNLSRIYAQELRQGDGRK